MIVEIFKKEKDPVERLRKLMKYLNTCVISETMLKVLFTDEEIKYLKSQGLTKVEGYVMNRRGWFKHV
jgi:hypothetical protein